MKGSTAITQAYWIAPVAPVALSAAASIAVETAATT
jgi:hypothetical protein